LDITPEKLIAQVQAQNRDGSEEERCETYRQVDEWLDGIGHTFPGAAECGAAVASK
jgi:hypothetical protein